MSTSSSTSSWDVFRYEEDMFISLIRLKSENEQYKQLAHHIQMAITESILLHTRILIDILLSRSGNSDDVRLKDMLPNFHSQKIDELRKVYGNRKANNTPCWTFNKMLAHPTTLRSTRYDYTSVMNQLIPIMFPLLAEIHIYRQNVT